MRVTMSFDERCEAWTLRCQGVRLDTPRDVAEWKERLLAQLERRARGHSFVLFDLAGLDIDMGVSEAFGQAARELERCTRLVPYGRGLGFTNTVLMLDAVRRRVPGRPFADRQSALASLGLVRPLPPEA